jgi:hypothetical protein
VNVRWHTVNQPTRKLVRKKDKAIGTTIAASGAAVAASDLESPVAASHSEAVDGDRREVQVAVAEEVQVAVAEEVQVAVAEEVQVVQGGTRNLRPRRARNLENT